MRTCLFQSWWQILTMIIAAGILSFIWTVVMRIFGSLMIWSSIGIIVVGLSVGKGHTLKFAQFDHDLLIKARNSDY